MKLVLIGYMASGKSAIGKLLANKLNYQFIDLDDYIVSKENCSISELFKNKGEIYFRLKETEYLQVLLESKDNIVLSTGGGTPCYGNNMNIINKLSESIYLKSSVKTIYNRLLSEKDSRPLVASIKNDDLIEFIGKHLFERAPFYEQATSIIKTDKMNLDEVVDSILHR